MGHRAWPFYSFALAGRRPNCLAGCGCEDSRSDLLQGELNRSQYGRVVPPSTILWFAQAHIAGVIQPTLNDGTQQLEASYADGEISDQATLKPYLKVRREARRAHSRFAARMPRNTPFL